MVLEELIEEIESRIIGEHFSIPVSEVLSHLDLSLEEYFRFRYNNRGSSARSLGDIPEDFTEKNTDELLDLLEHRGYSLALTRMEQSGLHFSSQKRIDLEEFFISVTLNRIRSHVVDEDLLETSLAGCLNPDDGYRFYMDACFDRNELMDQAVAHYLEYRELEDHALSRRILKDHLQRCFLTGQIDWDTIIHSCYEDLFPHRKARGTAHLSPDLQQALQEMELDYVPDREELKRKFRSLMFRYHPDRNPDGLEKTRRINESYCILLAGLYH